MEGEFDESGRVQPKGCETRSMQMQPFRLAELAPDQGAWSFLQQARHQAECHANGGCPILIAVPLQFMKQPACLRSQAGIQRRASGCEARRVGLGLLSVTGQALPEVFEDDGGHGSSRDLSIKMFSFCSIIDGGAQESRRPEFREISGLPWGEPHVLKRGKTLANPGNIRLGDVR